MLQKPLDSSLYISRGQFIWAIDGCKQYLQLNQFVAVICSYTYLLFQELFKKVLIMQVLIFCVMQCIVFVLFEVLHPSQQLWSYERVS